MDNMTTGNQSGDEDIHMMNGEVPPPPPSRVPPPPPPIPQRAAESVAASMKNLQGESMSEESPKVAPPPPPPIQVRSLQSDTTSLESSGGISAQPEIIKIDELGAEPSEATHSVVESPEAIAETSSSGWGWMSIIGMIVLAVIFALLGYYAVYPLIFPSTVGLPPEEKLGVAVPPPQKPIERLRHQSLFTKLPTLQGTTQLSSIDATTITTALQNEAVSSNAPIGAVKELALQFADSAVSFSDLFATLVPGVSKDMLRDVLEEDVTAFLYFNSKGIWPGYVVRLKQTTVVADAQNALAAIESYPLKGVYLSDPGAGKPFETGPYKGAPIRFSTFARSGASFNYGVIGNYAIFATSFDGFKAAVDLLGL